jgi:hypothetical protein
MLFPLKYGASVLSGLGSGIYIPIRYIVKDIPSVSYFGSNLRLNGVSLPVEGVAVCSGGGLTIGFTVLSVE